MQIEGRRFTFYSKSQSQCIAFFRLLEKNTIYPSVTNIQIPTINTIKPSDIWLLTDNTIKPTAQIWLLTQYTIKPYTIDKYCYYGRTLLNSGPHKYGYCNRTLLNQSGGYVTADEQSILRQS
jgi:hypothetical protein